MRLVPHNKNLTVELVDEEKGEEATILLPADYRPAGAPFAPVRVLDFAEDCANQWLPGTIVMIEAQMLREINFKDATFYTIGENYIIGAVET